MKKHVLLIYPLLISSCAFADTPAEAKPEEKKMPVEQPVEQKEQKPITPQKLMTRQKTITGLVEYEIIKEGTGNETPRKGQKITVNYTGWLNDKDQPGKKFDSSLDRKEPFSFTLGVGHVIRGWDDGLLGMKVGEKRRLYIPSSEGYGARGMGRTIPPHSDLIFDVELLRIG